MYVCMYIFVSSVLSSGVVAMVINGSSPSYSVVRHLPFQFHYLHVSVYSIHPPCPQSSYYFPGWFYPLSACTCMFRWSPSNIPNRFSRLSVVLLDIIFATPTDLRRFSFVIMSFRVTPHIHLNIFIIIRML